MTFDPQNPQHAFLLKFARAYERDPNLSPSQRSALREFSGNATISSAVFAPAMLAVQEWRSMYPDAFVFSAFAGPSEVEPIPNNKDILVAAEGFNGTITFDGRPAHAGWTEAGFGIELIKASLLKRYCGRQGIVIEVSRATFTLTAVDDMPAHLEQFRLSRSEKFNYDCSIWSGNGSAHFQSPQPPTAEGDDVDGPRE